MNQQELPCGIHKGPDGRYYMTRRHGDNIRWMDKRFQRAVKSTREFIWLDQPPQPDEALRYVGLLNDRTAVLLGKGPSLDRWLEVPISKPDNVLVSINEAYRATPFAPDFAFCLDPACLKRLVPYIGLHPSTTWILSRTIPNVAKAMTQPVSLADGKPPILPDGAKMARFTLGEFGTRVGMATAAAALRWLWLAGVRKVLMVGFDGFDEGEPPESGLAEDYAPSVLALGVKPVKLPSWEKVNRDIQAALDATGMEVTWYHREIEPAPTEGAESDATTSGDSTA